MFTPMQLKMVLSKLRKKKKKAAQAGLGIFLFHNMMMASAAK